MPQAQDVIKNALMDLGVYAQGEIVSADDLALGMSKLNRLLDRWNAQRNKVYAVQFSQYNLTPTLSPHTIGPGGTFNVTQRPVKILNANIILNTTNPVVRQPLKLQDADWWAFQRVQTIQISVPTDLYYEPAFPLGQLFFWPVPNTAFQAELETWSTLAAIVNPPDVLAFPPGWEDAITLTLAETLGPPFKTVPDPIIVKQAEEARDTIQVVNLPRPRMVTRDSGIPKSGRQRSTFNYLTGGSGTR